MKQNRGEEKMVPETAPFKSFRGKLHSVGYAQLVEIMEYILAKDTYPSWTFLNGVLDHPEMLGENRLWYSYGRLLIVRPEDEDKEAGDMDELGMWRATPEGKIYLIKRPKAGQKGYLGSEEVGI